jgi:ABC-type nitrate/sulfonate/bicarbonate transport system substrate-binding protein
MGIRSAVVLVAHFLTWQFSAGALQAQPVVMGYSGTGVSGTLRRVIEKEKLWQKRGLDVKAIYFGSGGVMSQAMVAGDILLSDSDVPAQLSPKVAGILDVRVIAVTINRLEHFVVVRNSVKTAEDLKGKRVAISRFGSASDITTKLALRFLKLNPERDVTILQAGNTPARISALVAGHVDGALVSPDQLHKVLASKCCKVLADLAEIPLDYARFGMVASLAVLRAQRETVRKLLEAYVEGIYIFKTRPDVPLAALRDEGIEDPQIAKGIHERIAGSLREYPIPEPKGVQAALDSIATAKERNPQAKDYMDTTFIEEIKNSGYIDRLYGKR